MTHRTHLEIAALLVLGICGLALAESVSVLLEKGIHQEETVGDLDGAMAIYRKIVEDAKADRKFVAQAQYRLGVCYLKKKQHRQAIATMEELLRTFPDREQLTGRARKVLAAAKGRMTGPELAKLVEDAVLVISTSTEGDPRVRKQIESLKDLNDSEVVKALKGPLDAEKDTVRRAAIFILWKGSFADISAAVPKLLKLCSHQEDITRGMAALALGGNKVASSYQALCDMTLKDPSGYARRCAAYALALLGRAEAKEVLQKALKDKDRLVQKNAEAALTMLARAAGAEPAGPKVVRSSPANLANDVSPQLKVLSITFDRKMKDRCWSWVQRWPDRFPKTAGESSYDAKVTTCSLPVKLEAGKVYWIGINTPPYTSFAAADGTPAQQHVLLFATKSADGRPTPIDPKLLAEAKEILASAGRPAPTVVSTAPTAMADDVPASLDKITVTFDQEMMDETWSWTQIGSESFPKMTGKPSYDKARRTCSLPVKLEGGKVYWLGINSEEDKYFQTAARKPARLYVILFATRGKDGKPTPIPQRLARMAEATNAASARGRVTDADRRAAESLTAEGWQLWQNRKLTEAEAKFRQALQKDPGSAEAWNGLGWAQENQGKFAHAKQAFQKCLAIEPKHAAALNGLGWIAKIEKKTDAALDYWRKAVEAMPGTTAALGGLTTTLTELGRYDEAIKYYEIWLKVDPDNAEVKAGLETARKALERGRERR